MMQLTQNEGQIAAIQHGAGPMLVLAGPGSGKTHVITHRIKRLVSECKIPPNQILVITFTKAAALEMQSRAILLQKQCAYVQFGTFHSVFYQILTLSKPDQRLSLASDRERLELIKAVLGENGTKEKAGIKGERETVQTQKELESRAQECLKEISRRKNQLPGPERDQRPGLEREQQPGLEREPDRREKDSFLYEVYQEWLSENQKLDFDDMIRLCYEYLNENPRERKMWQERFWYILIDEFQDINPLQYETVRLLCGNRNLFAVGDDDQAIYSFRGSDPMLMQRFVKDFSAQVVRLKFNYRCSAKIVKAASGFIAHNRRRFPKPCAAIKEAGEEIRVRGFSKRGEEVLFLKEEIARYQKENPCRSQAVLVRTNSLAAFFERELAGDGQKQSTVREDLFSYLRFLHCGRNREDFLKIMNKPMRYIGRNILTEQTIDFALLKRRLREKPWIEKRLAKLEEQLAFADGLDLAGQLRYFWKAMGYEQYSMEQAAGDKMKIRESAEAFQSLFRQAKGCKTLEELLELAGNGTGSRQNAENQAAENNNVKYNNENNNAKHGNVEIMTYHGSKGLEFDRVYLPELNYGIVPHGRMLPPEELEEERRMFYVALTRAKESLVLLYAKEQTVSPFLSELTL